MAIPVSYVSIDAQKIFYKSHRAEHEQARLVIVHGIGEHSGRYGNVISTLVPRNISVWAMDLSGHGKSGGRRGHILAFENYINEVSSMIGLVKRGMSEDSKCFLLGHSMGGLIALDFALRFPASIDGVIVSSPSLGITVKVPRVKKILGKVMSSVLPGLTLSNGLDITRLSHDEAVVRAYADDPLVHDRVSARWFTEILGAMEKVNNAAPKLEVPVLMQLAGDDHLTDVNTSKRFFGALSVADKTVHIYEGRYHEIYNESQKLRAGPLQDLSEWIQDHL